MNDLHEKRRITRADYRLSCALHVGRRVIPCLVHNISLTGLLIETDKSDGISAGQKANLVIEHFCPECTVSEIECEIVRENGRFFGLKVSAIDYDTFMQLKDLLTLLTPAEGKIDNEILNMIASKKENQFDV